MSTLDCAGSDDGPLALALRSLRFHSALKVLFASNCAAPLSLCSILCSLFPKKIITCFDMRSTAPGIFVSDLAFSSLNFYFILV